MVYLFLVLSISLSAVRNLLSKRLSKVKFGDRHFYIFQSVTFFCGAAALLTFGNVFPLEISKQTFVYALIYGFLLIFAQWFYTMSLTSGNTSVCSTVYSMGFILPTLSGAILWSEELNFFDCVGIVFAVAALLFSGVNKEKTQSSNKYFIPCLVAMLSSGGLGIMQKIQQRSLFPNQRGIFLTLAFLFAGVISLLFALKHSCTNEAKPSKRLFAFSAAVGFSFGCCNLLNTFLAGKLPSAFFFPVLNIGVIMITTVISILLYKEKLRKKEFAILASGIISIILLSIF